MGMQGIALDKGHAQMFRQAAGDGGLARTGHAHHHDQRLHNACHTILENWQKPPPDGPPGP